MVGSKVWIYQKNKVSPVKLEKYIKGEYLPINLQQVLNLIGLKLTLKLIRHYQGKKFYIPQGTYSQKTNLSQLLPPSALDTLQKAMGGCTIDLRKTSLKGVYNSAYFDLLAQQYQNSNLSFEQFIKAHNLCQHQKQKLRKKLI